MLPHCILMVYNTFLLRHSCASVFLISNQWESFGLLMNFNSSKFVVSVKHTRRGQDPQKYASFTRPGKHMSPRWASWYFILPEFSFSEAISSGKCVPAYLAGEAWSPPRNTGLIWSSGKKKKNHCFTTLYSSACAEMNTRKWSHSPPSNSSEQH